MCCLLGICAFSQTTLPSGSVSSPSIATLSSFGLKEGLPVNCLEGSLLDSKGRLWINPCPYNTVTTTLNFFQYDGKQAIFYELSPDWLEKNDTISWTITGETTHGFLFGVDLNFSNAFMWHPDSKDQYFFQFEEKEKVLNMVPGPDKSVLVLTLLQETYRLYRLSEEGKQFLEEISPHFEVDSTYAYPHPLVFLNQQIWFLHQRQGMVSFDLDSGDIQFLAWKDLQTEPTIKKKPDDIFDVSLIWQLLKYDEESLFLNLGLQNGFLIFDLNSTELKPHAQLNAIVSTLTVRDYRVVRCTPDQKRNILVEIDYWEPFANFDTREPPQTYLINPLGQIQNYTSLLEEIRASAQYQRLFSWEGYFFGKDFQHQLGWTSSGGMVITDLQMKFNIQAYPLNKGTRTIAFLDSNHLLVHSDGPTFRLNLKSGAYDFFSSTHAVIRILTSLERSDDHSLWVATQFGELQKHDLLNNNIETHPIGEPFDKFAFLNKTEVAFFDLSGKLFIYNLQTKTAKPYLIDGQHFSIENPVKDLLFEGDNLLWIGAQNGLWQLDLQQKQFTHFNQLEELKDANIMCIDKGKNGQFWIGTAQKGVLIFQPDSQKIKQITQVNGLSHNTIAGIQTDDNLNRWVATFDGLTVISPNAEVLFEIREENGLTHSEFNITSNAKLPDGRLAFGGIQGINILDPVEILRTQTQKEAPRIFLTHLEYFDPKTGENQTLKGSFNQKESIKIPATNRYLSIDFAISDYLSLKEHTYSYRLSTNKLGLSKDDQVPWTNLGSLSELTLNNLPVGDWYIQIRGVDHQGNRVETPLEIPIHVAEFFYRQWWFYVLCALPFLLGGWFWIRRILTERKRLKIEVDKRTKQIRLDKEIIAQQVEELQQFDRAKSRFFANISHELRTPLTIILGMVDQVEKQPGRWLKQGTKMIRNNGSNLLELVNQILELQKLESGNLKVNLQLDDIIPFLRSIFNQFKALGLSKNLQMDFISEKESLLMDFDPEKILRIASNLLSNAIKYTPENGKVNVLISSGKLNEFSEEDHLILTVEDTGRGIHHEELPYIFDRFYQATSQEKTSSGGTGIGLSLTQELVKLLNGKIEVVSQLGKGTTFQVFLPISQKARPGQNNDQVAIQAAILGSQGPLKKEKIAEEDLPLALIVEDNADIAQYLQICLEGSYRMLFAKNGQEGINQALEQIPDIIVSDVMMPEKNGFELCEALKEDIRSSHIPIILLTAKSDVESRIAGLKQGADDYLAKPFNEEELLVRMKNLLEIRLKLQQRYQNPFDPGFSKPKASTPTKEDAFILNLKEVFEAHMDDLQYDLDQLSQELFLSRSQLGRKVKALTGKSPAVYLRSLRLQKARQLLLTSALSIKEVAYDVGFSDPSYFSRAYSEEFGESPSNTGLS